MQILVKHADNLRDITVPLDKASELASELVSLVNSFLVVAVSYRQQSTGHSPHSLFVLLVATEIHLCKGFNVIIRVDTSTTEFLLCLVNQVGIDFLLQIGFLVERLECFQNIFLFVHEVENKGVMLTGTSPVQTGKCLHSLDAFQLLVHDHRMEQWLVKAGLILLSNNQHIEVVVKFCLGLTFRNVGAIPANIQPRLSIFFTAIVDRTGERHQYIYIHVFLLLDVSLHFMVIPHSSQA